MTAQGDADVIREMLRRFAERDNEGSLALVHPDVVLDTTHFGDMAMVTGVYHGHVGLLRFWAEWLGTWKSVTFDYDDFREGPNGVVVQTTQTTVGRLSGAAAPIRPYWVVYGARDGLMSSMHLFDDHDVALSFAGLA